MALSEQAVVRTLPRKNAALKRALESLLRLDAEIEPAGYLRSLLQSLRGLEVNEVLEAMRQPEPLEPLLRVVPQSKPQLFADLSDREIDVVRLVTEGLSNKEISVRLELSDKTVKNHISHILAKMGLSARTQVAVCALREGIL